ncbi:transcriptional regulator with PAS, ATPase and Fis domain [Scopulibacillus darangshiensis]|uniref:Transcriptional regulator with PAS, ATPase and Fis domain n=1 Tax=Scopulibacillus darangshiensis TaxID=442528 RepID=A0A4R2NQ09_9BACL|nr:sigma-54-dependent transcriptional regulator [Scopulibacillus darangshiensis]TCP23762.1 transcriptional regulator with PAS, ATPase and Fis domain [Scopulibacillus darangshiensis]
MKIVVIAPYSGLRELIVSLGEKEDNIELQVEVEVGDLNEGVKIAAEAERNGADIIISRGGTAKLIQEQVSIPVIDIEVSGYDMLRVLTLVKGFPGKAAIVGFPTIAEGAAIICSLLDIDISTYTIFKEEDVKPKLLELQKDDYHVIVGDVITVQKAEELGFNGILLTSGKESVLKAFKEAKNAYKFLTAFKKDLVIPNSIVEQADEGVIVFDGDLKPVFLNRFVKKLPEEKLKHLLNIKKWALSIIDKGPFKTIVETEDGLLEITGFPLKGLNEPYAAFRVKKTNLFHGEKVQGLYIRCQVPGDASHTVKGISGSNDIIMEVIERAKRYSTVEAPIWITGEQGTGKERIANFIHSGSSESSYPFIKADCHLIPDKAWDQLLSGDPSHDHLLSYVEKGTFFLKDIHHLTMANQKVLLDYLNKNTDPPFRIIVSSFNDIHDRIEKGLFDQELYNLLASLNLTLPPLKNRIEDIEILTRLFINEFNIKYGKQVSGIREIALQKLKDHDWPNNVDQLKRVVEELVILSDNPYIGLEDVDRVMYTTVGDAYDEKCNIELTGTLEEIERKVISRVMEEEGMNQSKAAKRLGINRSTLWRKLK